MVIVFGKLLNCYNKGEIESNGCGFLSSNSNIGMIGGISGYSLESNILNCYNKGNIKASPSTEDQRGSVAGGVVGKSTSDNIMNIYNEGNIITNGNSYIYVGGVIAWVGQSVTGNIKNLYNIGTLTGNATTKAVVNEICESDKVIWSNMYWLDSVGLTYGSSTSSPNALTSDALKSLVSNGGLPNTDWAVDSNINNGYPHLKAFDNTNIWLRDDNINDGDPYLKENTEF